jgi:tRNA G18 (ribose-2'-O)-methylase SpoU
LFDDEPTYENFIGKINDEETAKKFEDRILRRSQTTQLLSAVKDRLGEDYDVPLSKANLIGNVLQTVTAPLKNIGSAARSARAAEIQPIILNTDKKKVAESLLKLTPEALALVASQRRNSYAANIAKTLLTIEAGASVGGD